MTRPGRIVLRRVGGVGVALALAALGLAAGLAWTGPSRAGISDSIQVKMPGDAAFSGAASRPLLDVGELAPGGTVSGVMTVRDNSGTTVGSGTHDSLYLTMIDVRTGDTCAAGGRSCAGSGGALAGALRFDLRVTDGTTGAVLRHSAETVASLRRGIPLASGLADGDELGVRLTASLPSDTGNGIADGSVGFGLQLDMITVAGESEQAGGGGTTGSGGSDGGGSSGSPGGTLVIGGGGADLASTGAPVWWLLGAGAALLVAGLALLIPGRRDGRRGIINFAHTGDRPSA